MSLAAGTRLGPYEIVAAIGAGGMGEVYKARDTRLDRTVAVKVLPGALAADPQFRERFDREARAISQLSHPHICALFDVGEAPNPESHIPNPDPIRFLVMELLDGETLADRLAKGPLPIAQSLRYGIEIADALDTAHRQGIVHRDLKPANIFLARSAGPSAPPVVKLLDFGLAKVVEPPVPASAPSVLATAAAPADLTEQGTFLGTLQYMAPEQVEAGRSDARSDIFALGVVLYEMATGKKAFAGGSRVALASAILTHEPPPISAVQPVSPPALDRLVKTCLEKDPEQRWQSARDVRLQLDAIRENATSATAASSAVRARPGWLLWAPWAAASVAALLALTLWLRPAALGGPAPATIRFSVPPPPGGSFFNNLETTTLALSPDGSQLAFSASDPAHGRQIWMRPLAALDARPLAGTDGAVSVFWSPDGRSLGFFAGDKLKRIDPRAGAAVTVCSVRGDIGLFGTWGADGQIVFASVEGEAIFRVPAAGGEPVEVLKPDPGHGEVRANWPWFLPDGRRFLFTMRLKDGTGRLMLADPGHPPRPILPVVSNVQYVDPGYLVFGREGTLVGQRFDQSRAEAVGEPFSLAGSVSYFFSTAMTWFATSPGGTLVLQAHLDQQRLAWIDRSGGEVGSVAPLGTYQRLRISPDGRRAVFDRAQGGSGDSWTIDFERGVETRLTSDPGSEGGGTWLPDGRALFFAADRGGPPHLFRKNLTTGAEEEVTLVRTLQQPEDVSPDGASLVYSERATRGNFDLWVLPVGPGGKPSPLLQTPFNEVNARFSPDGRAMAFMSDESGRPEVYVAPYPALGEKTRVSTGGARLPRWSREGRELFYLSADRHLMTVPVRATHPLEWGAPASLFALSGSATWADYDVSLDGKKFLAVVPEVVASQQPLTVVLNWPAAIGR